VYTVWANIQKTLPNRDQITFVGPSVTGVSLKWKSDKEGEEGEEIWTPRVLSGAWNFANALKVVLGGQIVIYDKRGGFFQPSLSERQAVAKSLTRKFIIGFRNPEAEKMYISYKDSKDSSRVKEILCTFSLIADAQGQALASKVPTQ
jgi:hypothetical protein